MRSSFFFLMLSVSATVILSGCAETTQLVGAERIEWERCNQENWFPSLSETPILRAQACEETIAKNHGRPPPPKPTSILNSGQSVFNQLAVEESQRQAELQRRRQLAQQESNRQELLGRQQSSPSQYGNTTRPTQQQGAAHSSDVADFPIPDANQCMQVRESVRGKQCGTADSMSVTMVNTCSQQINMQLCLFDSQRNRWSCGTYGAAAPGQTIYSYVCHSDGRNFLYGGCSRSSRQGSFHNGNCGGDPNGISSFR